MKITGRDNYDQFEFDNFQHFLDQTNLIKSLTISNCALSTKQLADLLKKLHNENVLTKISFFKVSFIDDSEFENKDVSIKLPDCLKAVVFKGCLFNEGALEILKTSLSLTSGIKSVNFSNCNLGDVNSQTIVKALSSNNSLSHLNFSGNNMSDLGVNSLIELVNLSVNIINLDIRKNDIKPHLLNKLVNTINKNAVLSSLFISLEEDISKRMPCLLKYNGAETPLYSKAKSLLDELDAELLSFDLIDNFEKYSATIERILILERKMCPEEAKEYLIFLALPITNYLSEKMQFFKNFTLNTQCVAEAKSQYTEINYNKAKRLKLSNSSVTQSDSDSENKENNEVSVKEKNIPDTMVFSVPFAPKAGFRNAISRENTDIEKTIF